MKKIVSSNLVANGKEPRFCLNESISRIVLLTLTAIHQNKEMLPEGKVRLSNALYSEYKTLENELSDSVPFKDIPIWKVEDFLMHALVYGDAAFSREIRGKIEDVLDTKFKWSDTVALCLIELEDALRTFMEEGDHVYDLEATSITAIEHPEIDPEKLAMYIGKVPVLVVDDMKSVRRMLSKMLGDSGLIPEGDAAVCLHDGKDFVALYKRSCVSYVLDHDVDPGKHAAIFSILELQNQKNEDGHPMVGDLECYRLRDSERSVFEYEVIFLDNSMPGMTGAEALKVISQIKSELTDLVRERCLGGIPSLSIVGVSADNCPMTFIKEGAVGFIHKPFTRDKLMATVLSTLPDVYKADEAWPSQTKVDAIGSVRARIDGPNLEGRSTVDQRAKVHY